MTTLQERPTTTLPAGLNAGTYQIDPAHSEIGFFARHAMVTKVRGSFSDITGDIVIDENNPKVNVTIGVASVSTRSDDRDGHLRSPDFFDVEKFPTATFESREITSTSDGFTVTGDFTLHGVTKSVTLDIEANGSAVDPFGATRVGFDGSFDINRKDYGLIWNAALETGGVLVSEKVKITLDISAILQK